MNNKEIVNRLEEGIATLGGRIHHLDLLFKSAPLDLAGIRAANTRFVETIHEISTCVSLLDNHPEYENSMGAEDVWNLQSEVDYLFEKTVEVSNWCGHQDQIISRGGGAEARGQEGVPMLSNPFTIDKISTVVKAVRQAHAKTKNHLLEATNRLGGVHIPDGQKPTAFPQP